MPSILSAINGKKFYIGALVGTIALVCHKLGIPIPGVEINDDAIMQNLWLLWMGSAAAHKLQKVADAINNQEPK
jgi:hypothetical protein